jgi:hypothetical protein
MKPHLLSPILASPYGRSYDPAEGRPRKSRRIRPLYVMTGSVGLIILWIELFRHACL